MPDGALPHKKAEPPFGCLTHRARTKLSCQQSHTLCFETVIHGIVVMLPQPVREERDCWKLLIKQDCDTFIYNVRMSIVNRLTECLRGFFF